MAEVLPTLRRHEDDGASDMANDAACGPVGSAGGCGVSSCASLRASEAQDRDTASWEDGAERVGGYDQCKRGDESVGDDADPGIAHPERRSEMRRPTSQDPLDKMDEPNVDGEEPSLGPMGEAPDANSVDAQVATMCHSERVDDGVVQGYEIIVPQCRGTGGAAMVVPLNAFMDINAVDQGPCSHGTVDACKDPMAAPGSKDKKPVAQGHRNAPQSPPDHIYALREIVRGGGNKITNGEKRGDEDDDAERIEEKKEEGCDPLDNSPSRCGSGSDQTPRIVTAQVIRASEEIYQQLEGATAGTVLCCPASIRGATSRHFSVRDVASASAEEVLKKASREASMEAARESARELSLSIAAVPASSLRKEIEGMLEGQHRSDASLRYPFACDEAGAAASKGGTRKSEAKRGRWRSIPGRILRSVKRIARRKKKTKNGDKAAKNKTPVGASRSCGGNSQGGPKLIITSGGTIDWDRSDLDGCHLTPGRSSCVTYTANDAALAAPVMNAAGLGSAIFGDEAVIGNRIEPIEEIVPVSTSLGVYISESGLSYSDCRNIIDVAERCAADRGGWSSYTYAKQTLGCREDDRLAFVCAKPVMKACATIRRHLRDVEEGTGSSPAVNASDKCGEGTDTACEKEKDMAMEVLPKELILDVREPHVVKYDTTRVERGKLDMHTDKSTWTFLIALSEGRGQDYSGGGTYFQSLNSVTHLQRGQMLVFRGKLRHSGVRISAGCRHLLVGFLVPKAGGAATKVGGVGVSPAAPS